MILITGGLGFLGPHTARALLDLGESCLLTGRHRPARLPDFLAAEPDGRLAVEQLDVTDLPALLEAGRRHAVTGIVHLAAPRPGALAPVDDLGVSAVGLLNVLRAAEAWQVPRVAFASTIGVYHGVPATRFSEEMPLPVVSGHAIPAAKKSCEVLASHAADSTDLEVVILRLSAMWGPLGRTPSPFFAAPQLVHAAVAGGSADAYAEDGIDMCYVKDAGRAVALLQTAPALNHRTYNVGSGHVTKNKEVADALTTVLPGTRPGITAGRDPKGPGVDFSLDTTRLRQDTGFSPAYDVGRGVGDYVSWLAAGNER